MRKLIINSITADVDDREVIALSKESNELFDFSNKRSNLSNTLKLPKSQTNNKIFGAANDVTAVLRYTNVNKRNYYDVQYIQNYTEIIKAGKGILNKVEADHYQFIIYWGNIDIKEKLGDATLQDLDFSDLDHEFSLSHVASTLDGDYFYPIMDNSIEKTLKEGTEANKIDAEKLIPVVSVKRILDQITRDFDISYEGLEEKIDADSLTIPCTNRTMPNILSEEAEHYRVGQNAINTGQTKEEKFNLQYGEDDTYSVDAGTWNVAFIINLRHVRLRRGSSLLIGRNKFISRIVIFAEREIDGTWQNYTTYEQAIAAINAGETLGTTLTINRNQIFEGDKEWDVSLSSERIFTFSAGDKIRFRLINRVEDDSTFVSGTGFFHNTYQEGGSFNIGYDKMKDGYPVYINQSLPDVKILDFLKYLAAKTSSLIDLSEGSNKIKFVSLRDFAQNTQNSQDISNTIQSVEIEALHNNLGRANIMKYDNHDDLSESHGEGSFQIDDNTLEPVKEFYEAPFSATENIQWREWLTAHLPLFDEEPEESADIGSRILKKKLITTDEVFYEFDGAAVSHTLSLNIGLFTRDLDFRSIIDARYAEYIQVMNDYKRIKALAYLTETQFVSLDLMKPVYIKQLGGYFLINKVHNYVEGKLTEIILTMLSYPVTPVVDILPPVPPPPPPTYKLLTLTVRENGEVTIKGKTYKTGSHIIYIETDTTATITGVPDEDYQFYKWTGAVASLETQIDLVMSENRALTAWFTLPRIKLEDSTGHILTEDGTYIFLE